MITEYGVNSHAHDALPATGKMRCTKGTAMVEQRAHQLVGHKIDDELHSVERAAIKTLC